MKLPLLNPVDQEKKRIFYSFHFDNDNWRVQMIRNIGSVVGREPVLTNTWENVRTTNNALSIISWIDNQLQEADCVIVLIGSETASRHWVNYEIRQAVKKNIPIFGIHIHCLGGSDKTQGPKGANPFNCIPEASGRRVHDPPFRDSPSVYNYISQNLAYWVDEAINKQKISDLLRKLNPHE